ncbi:MAG: aminotransferase class IV [Rickettsiales bacterium]
MDYLIFNDKLIKEDKACISPQDRGFRYGDGIFDTIIIKNSKLYQWEWHLARIEKGLNAVKINYNTCNLQSLSKKLLKKNNIKNGLLRIQITRGIGGRGYMPQQGINPTVIIETMEKPQLKEKYASLWLSSYKKISTDMLPVQYKLCQGLNSTLARIEAIENECFDALLLNNKNEICETSSANIFWLKDNILHTPSLSCGMLEGSIRATLIKLYKNEEGKVKEVAATINELKSADAVFITNVAWKILPIIQIQPIELKWQYQNVIKLIEPINNLLEIDIEKT